MAHNLHYQLIGILGGTFDPVHNGHLAIAKSLMEKIPFDQIQFIPCNQPPHRDMPKAGAGDRVRMLKLALEQYPQFHLNEIELQREGPSFMVDTLTILHKTFPQNALALIMGIEVFAKFNEWHRWQDILSLTHLIIVNRPNYVLSEAPWLRHVLKQHQCFTKETLLTKPNGLIYFEHIPPQLISSSNIREDISAGRSIEMKVPLAIAHYITQHQLYLL